jgi:branched-chain amino acid aminotransferase
MRETEKIWMNGELVAWDDARIHVGTHGLHYGSGVFEGIRAYETPNGTAVFRLTDHLKRLENSAKLLGMDLSFSVEDLRAASHELIAVNGLPECYLRPIAFFGYGELGVSAVGNPVDVVIMSWPWGAYLGEDGLIYTPDLSTSILPGITRDTVIQIAQDLGYRVVEKSLIRSDLYLADEAFMCGTAAEVTPLREVDDVELGVGPVTLELQAAYIDTVRGRSERWAQWLEYAERTPAEA